MQKKGFVLAALLPVVMTTYSMDPHQHDHPSAGQHTPKKLSPLLRSIPLHGESLNIRPISPLALGQQPIHPIHVTGRGSPVPPLPAGLRSITPTPPSSEGSSQHSSPGKLSASSSPQSSPEQLSAGGSLLSPEEQKRARQISRGIKAQRHGTVPFAPVALSAASGAPGLVPAPIAAAAADYVVRTHIRKPEDPVFSHSAGSPFSSGTVSSSLSVPKHLLPQDPQDKKQS